MLTFFARPAYRTFFEISQHGIPNGKAHDQNFCILIFCYNFISNVWNFTQTLLYHIVVTSYFSIRDLDSCYSYYGYGDYCKKSFGLAVFGILSALSIAEFFVSLVISVYCCHGIGCCCCGQNAGMDYIFSLQSILEKSLFYCRCRTTLYQSLQTVVH